MNSFIYHQMWITLDHSVYKDTNEKLAFTFPCSIKKLQQHVIISGTGHDSWPTKGMSVFLWNLSSDLKGDGKNTYGGCPVTWIEVEYALVDVHTVAASSKPLRMPIQFATNGFIREEQIFKRPCST